MVHVPVRSALLDLVQPQQLAARRGTRPRRARARARAAPIRASRPAGGVAARGVRGGRVVVAARLREALGRSAFAADADARTDSSALLELLEFELALRAIDGGALELRPAGRHR